MNINMRWAKKRETTKKIDKKVFFTSDCNLLSLISKVAYSCKINVI